MHIASTFSSPSAPHLTPTLKVVSIVILYMHIIQHNHKESRHLVIQVVHSVNPTATFKFKAMLNSWHFMIFTIIVLRLRLTYEREVTRRHSTREAKRSFFSASMDLDITTYSPLTRLAMAPTVTQVSCFKPCMTLTLKGGPVNTKE